MFYDLSLQFSTTCEMKVGMIITKQVLLSSFMARNGLCHWEMQFVKPPPRSRRPHAWMWKYSRKTRRRERETKRKRTAAGKSYTGWPDKFCTKFLELKIWTLDNWTPYIYSEQLGEVCGLGEGILRFKTANG